MSSLGSRIRALRNHDESQEDFARLLGVSRSTLIRYENDECLPDSAFLLALHQKTSVNLHWLITGEPQKLPVAPKPSGITIQMVGGGNIVFHDQGGNQIRITGGVQ